MILPLFAFKTGSNSSGFVQYWMNQRRFFGNDFFYKKFAYSASVKIRSRHSLCAEYRVLAKPNNRFWSRIWKIWFKNLWGGTNSPCLLRLQTRKFLCRKITVRFKLNLKTDGPDCKMIFKFGSRVERLHSSRKQGRRIYLLLLRCKNTCWEIPNPWTASDGCRLSVSKWESLWL